MVKPLFAMATLFFLTACGFEPLYGEVQDHHLEVGTYLAATKIRVNSGALGQELKITLEDHLNPEGRTSLYGEAFLLVLDVKNKREAEVIEQDGSISRYGFTLVSTYRLYDAKTHEILTKGIIRRTASFNNADAKFASYIAERDAMHDALKEMAEDYKMRLAAYFASNRTL